MTPSPRGEGRGEGMLAYLVPFPVGPKRIRAKPMMNGPDCGESTLLPVSSKGQVVAIFQWERGVSRFGEGFAIVPAGGDLRL